jgi:hypothetical protein
MAQIIVSYRRADSDAIAGRIRDRLANHFGENSIFMDIDSIPFGIDFRDHIQEALRQNDILIAVIGPKWLGLGKGGHARIMEETDPVRLELETALSQGSPVIPVLVNGARMPKPSELPDSLKDLAYRNAADVDAGRDFHQHMDRLIRSMDRILAAKSKSPLPIAESTAEKGSPAISSPSASLGDPAAVVAPATSPTISLREPPRQIHSTDGQMLAPEEKNTTTPGYKRATWLVIALTGVVCASLAAAAWLYLRTGQQTAQVTAPAPQAQPQPPPSPQPPPRPATTVATGCKLNPAPTFIDDFKTVDPGWNLGSPVAYYVDGQVELKGLEGKFAIALYQPFRFKDLTLCATIKSPSVVGSSDITANGGIVFWATDTSNFYSATLQVDGSYEIYRQANGSWLPVIPRTRSDNINTGANAINEIRVTTADTIATLYINGTKVQEFRGQPPKQKSMIGIFGASNKDERNDWRVLTVAVTDPDQPQPKTPPRIPTPSAGPGCKPQRSAAFSDNFTSRDPAWGVIDNSPASYADNQLVIKPNPSQGYKLVYPLLFANATICAHMKSPVQMGDTDDFTSAGIMFWVQDLGNAYVAQILPNGRFVMFRMVDAAWVVIAPAAKSDAVKQGLGAVNELMVTFNNNIGSFYINSKKVWDFKGQPPKGGGSIGFYAGSDAKEPKPTEWRFLDIAVVENE